MFYLIFSSTDDFFPLKHLSYYFLSVVTIFWDLVIGTVDRLSVKHWPVRRLSADDRQIHFKLPRNERQSAIARSMIERQSADFKVLMLPQGICDIYMF